MQWAALPHLERVRKRTAFQYGFFWSAHDKNHSNNLSMCTTMSVLFDGRFQSTWAVRATNSYIHGELNCCLNSGVLRIQVIVLLLVVVVPKRSLLFGVLCKNCAQSTGLIFASRQPDMGSPPGRMKHYLSKPEGAYYIRAFLQFWPINLGLATVGICKNYGP